MTQSKVLDSTILITLVTAALYIVGYVRDSGELFELDLPNSFLLPKESLIRLGFVTAYEWLIYLIPFMILLGLTIWIFIRLTRQFSKLRSKLDYIRALHERYAAVIFVILAFAVSFSALFNAGSKGRVDASKAALKGFTKDVEIRFQDGSLMHGYIYRSDDQFIVIMERNEPKSFDGNIKIIIRRRDEVSEIRMIKSGLLIVN